MFWFESDIGFTLSFNFLLDIMDDETSLWNKKRKIIKKKRICKKLWLHHCLIHKCKKFVPCIHWLWKYFQITDRLRLKYWWFFEILWITNFCLIISEILQLIFQNGLNQLDFWQLSTLQPSPKLWVDFTSTW